MSFPKLHSWWYHAGKFQIAKFFFQLTITDNILAYCNFFLVSAIRKYGVLNGLSTETYETLHKYYVKNPYHSSNRKNVL